MLPKTIKYFSSFYVNHLPERVQHLGYETSHLSSGLGYQSGDIEPDGVGAIRCEDHIGGAVSVKVAYDKANGAGTERLCRFGKYSRTIIEPDPIGAAIACRNGIQVIIRVQILQHHRMRLIRCQTE